MMCPDCQGDGEIIEAGSCGGGCDFCPPGRRCNECRGTGEVEANDDECPDCGKAAYVARDGRATVNHTRECNARDWRPPGVAAVTNPCETCGGTRYIVNRIKATAEKVECPRCATTVSATAPVVAAEASMSTDSGKLTPKCAGCEETSATVRLRDGTGEPGADLCDECIAEYRRNDVDPVQY